MRLTRTKILNAGLNWVGVVTCLFYLGLGLSHAEQVAIPDLSHRVTDLTQTLTPVEIEQLAQKLATLEKNKGSQIAVLILPTTGEESIEQTSIRVVDSWKLGRKGVGDGVLLLIAKNDRKIRIEVGRGLEGALPDVIAARIIRETIRPQFKQGHYAQGIDAGLDQIITVISGEVLPPTAGRGISDEFQSDHPSHKQAFRILGLHPIVWGIFLLIGLAAFRIFGPWLGRGSAVAMGSIAAILAGASITAAIFAGLILGLILILLTSSLFWNITGDLLQSGISNALISGSGGGFGGGDSSSSSNDGFSGGGGDFGGGGASGDW